MWHFIAWNTLDNEITAYPFCLFLLLPLSWRQAWILTRFCYFFLCWLPLFWLWLLGCWLLAAAVSERHSPALEVLEHLARSNSAGNPRNPLAMLRHGWAVRGAGGWAGFWQNSKPPWLPSELGWINGCGTFQGGRLGTDRPDSLEQLRAQLFENCGTTQ